MMPTGPSTTLGVDGRASDASPVPGASAPPTSTLDGPSLILSFAPRHYARVDAGPVSRGISIPRLPQRVAHALRVTPGDGALESVWYGAELAQGVRDDDYAAREGKEHRQHEHCVEEFAFVARAADIPKIDQEDADAI